MNRPGRSSKALAAMKMITGFEDVISSQFFFFSVRKVPADGIAIQ